MTRQRTFNRKARWPGMLENGNWVPGFFNSLEGSR